jgi:hypothetical protein
MKHFKGGQNGNAIVDGQKEGRSTLKIITNHSEQNQYTKQDKKEKV